MANLLLQCTTPLLLLLLVFLVQHPTTISSYEDEVDSLDEYTLDFPTSTSKTQSRFFMKRIRKDMKCTTNHQKGLNVCEGISANDGNALLWCCNNKCRDVFSDVHHCGFCGHSCPFGLLCCRGRCIDVRRNPMHCGMCHHRCPPGVPCEFGFCGYA